jgi:hypothetical protein
VVPSTEDELRAAFAPLVSSSDSLARTAIIESAPRFLEPEIARFATEDSYGSPAIEALGRIATTSSRAHLRSLFRNSSVERRSAAVLTLARIGHRDDAEFLAAVLEDGVVDEQSRGYAALGLGRIGGVDAVAHLERALPAAPPQLRKRIAIALGNSRSAAAMPVLLGMLGNNPAWSQVCNALHTLTHRRWCDEWGGDPAAKRRKWLRQWHASASTSTLYGPDDCPVVSSIVSPLPPLDEEPRAPVGPPRITAVYPRRAAPNSLVEVTGLALGLHESRSVRVVFTQEQTVEQASILTRGSSIVRDRSGNLQYGAEYMTVVVPAALTTGRWQMVVEANGRRSAPVPVTITLPTVASIADISPRQPHPSQSVLIATATPPHRDDYVQLTDAQGTRWRLVESISTEGVGARLPDEVAEGEASVQVGRTVNGRELLSAPRKFVVTSSPLPLKETVVAGMTPAAPGEWTDFQTDSETDFEIERADRVEVEFRQGGVALTSVVTGGWPTRVQVPRGLIPGPALVRTRTWIDNDASDWSAPVRFRVLRRPASAARTP